MPRGDGRGVQGRHRMPFGETRGHFVRIPRSGRLPQRRHRGLSSQLPVVPRRRGAGPVPRSNVRHSGLHQQRRRLVRLRRGAGRSPASGQRPSRSAEQLQTLQEPRGLHLRHGLRRGRRDRQSPQPRRQLVRRDLLPAAQEDAGDHRRGRSLRSCREARLRRTVGRSESRTGTQGDSARSPTASARGTSGRRVRLSPKWARSPATPWPRP